MAWLESNSRCAEARRCPRKQHVDGNKRRLIARERLAQLCWEYAKRAHVFRHIAAYRRAQRKACDTRCKSPDKPVLLRFWCPVNYIESFVQSRQQPRNFFG